MVGLLVVLDGVPVGGLVRAANLAAGEAHPQLHPPVSAPQARDASARSRFHPSYYFVMRARAHVRSPPPPRQPAMSRRLGTLSRSVGTGRSASSTQPTAMLRYGQDARRSRPSPFHDHQRRPPHAQAVGRLPRRPPVCRRSAAGAGRATRRDGYANFAVGTASGPLAFAPKSRATWRAISTNAATIGLAGCVRHATATMEPSIPTTGTNATPGRP